MFISELYRLKYLLFLELSLLAAFAIFELIPFLVILAVVILIPLIYFTFKVPIIAVHILIFSILVDAVIPFKNVSKGPTLFIEEIFLGLFLALFTIKFLLNLNNDIKIPLIILIFSTLYKINIQM